MGNTKGYVQSVMNAAAFDRMEEKILSPIWKKMAIAFLWKLFPPGASSQPGTGPTSSELQAVSADLSSVAAAGKPASTEVHTANVWPGPR